MRELQLLLVRLQAAAGSGTGADCPGDGARGVCQHIKHSTNVTRLQVALTAAETRRQVAEDRVRDSERSCNQASSRASAAEQRSCDLQQQLTAAADKAARLKEKISRREQQLQQAADQLATMQQQVQRLTLSEEAASQARQQLADASQTAAKASASQAEQLQRMQQQLQQATQLSESLRSQLGAADTEGRHLRQELASERSVVATLQQQLVDATAASQPAHRVTVSSSAGTQTGDWWQEEVREDRETVARQVQQSHDRLEAGVCPGDLHTAFPTPSIAAAGQTSGQRLPHAAESLFPMLLQPESSCKA